MRAVSRANVSVASHDIDLAPMLDFVVNLLIFFIITAVFIRQAGLEVNRPSGASGPDKISKSVVIDGDGELAIDGKAIDLRAVRAHVEQLKAVESEASVVVLADEDAPTGMVVAVADQVRLGGVSDITFTTHQLTESHAR